MTVVMDPDVDVTIREPGIYPDVPELDYHSDRRLTVDFGPSLSSTGARTLLDSPARYRWERDNPPPPKAAFDVGHAVHAKVLGVGLNIAVIPDDTLGANGSTNTKAAQEFIKAARKEGNVPIKSSVAAEVDAMAEAVLTHKVAGAILSQGEPEQSLYWQTDGITRRARIDWLRPNAAVDLKTGRSADPRRFGKIAADYGYEVQADWYLAGLTALGYDPDLPFLHVLVESDPPHLVSVVQLDQEALEVGHARSRAALDIYRKCIDTDTWPAYSDDIESIALPSWHVRNHL